MGFSALNTCVMRIIVSFIWIDAHKVDAKFARLPSGRRLKLYSVPIMIPLLTSAAEYFASETDDFRADTYICYKHGAYDVTFHFDNPISGSLRSAQILFD